MDIWFLDIEASSLEEGGYPIEIAWVDRHGEGESHLIRPTDAWVAGSDPSWHEAGETVHGISRETLARDGGAAADVARRAASVLLRGDCIVVSDAPSFDQAWLDRLFRAADLERMPRVRDVRELYGAALLPLRDALIARFDGLCPDAVEALQEAAMEIVATAEAAASPPGGPKHRAMADATALWRSWRGVEDAVARRLAETA